MFQIVITELMIRKMIRIKEFLYVLVFVGLVFSLPIKGQAQKKKFQLQKIPGVKPLNVIFILSDDHRYDFIKVMN